VQIFSTPRLDPRACVAVHIVFAWASRPSQMPRYFSTSSISRRLRGAKIASVTLTVMRPTVRIYSVSHQGLAD